MKNKVGFYLISFFIILVTSSCSSVNTLTISVIEPPLITIPSSIKKIGILNRSKASQKNKKVDAIDKIISLEGLHLDKKGADKCIEGLQNELLKFSTFASIKKIDSFAVESPGFGVFPSALTWQKIGEICEKNKVDVIFALELFDTDTKVDYSNFPTQINTPIGIKIPAIQHQAIMTTAIKSGWRIYDYKNQLILDEQVMQNNISFEGSGINPLKAIEGIIGRKEAVLDISTNMGQFYASKITPTQIRIQRIYYVRGTKNFKIAKRNAQVGYWKIAAEFWEKETKNSNAKIAGKAFYNMAVFNEINGNLETAIDFASKSYVNYKNKRALSYVSLLKHRLHKNERQLIKEGM